MLKVALPIIMMTISINALASSAVLISDGASVPAEQAAVTNDTVQQATLNAQIAQDTVNMNSALDEINTMGDTNVDAQTASYQADKSSTSQDVSDDSKTQDATIYVDTSNKASAKSTTDNDKASNENSTVTIKAKSQPNPNAVTFTAKENSLEKNINSWAKKYGYKVVWDVTNSDSDEPADFQWIGDETIHGATETDVLKQLVDGYPVNTSVWSQNNVICFDNNNQCSKEAAK